MKINRLNKSIRVYLSVSILTILTIIGGIYGSRTSALSKEQSLREQNSDEFVTVKPESPNSPTINLRPGRSLPTDYISGDDSSSELKFQPSIPLNLSSADFNADGYPDLMVGYSVPGGGVLTFHKGNSEAFAPQNEESLALLRQGQFPDPFLKSAESFALPAAPDFLVAGDFDRDGDLDVVTGERGSEKIYLLSGAGKNGGFNTPREINLSGRITTLTAGEIDFSDNRADLLIGIENEQGAFLLAFKNPESGVLGSPENYRLPSAAISLEIAQLDDDSTADTAILMENGVSILHGRNSRTNKTEAKSFTARLEKINFPFVPQALAAGNFIWDQAGKTELALLAEDGTVQIAKRGQLDERLFSVAEIRANRLQAAQRKSNGANNDDSKFRQSENSEEWTIADQINIGASTLKPNSSASNLMKANLSGLNTDDILYFDSNARKIKILTTQEPEKVNGEATSFAGARAIYTLEAAEQPSAVLSMKLNIFARPGLVILQNGKIEPSFVTAAPTAVFDVDRTDDTNAAGAQACTAAAGDCSLRGAITKANAAAGADMINVPAGTYTLSVGNGGTAGTNNNEDNNATGDLDINQDLTITGAGQAATIIQGGTSNANGIDKVFASNPQCAAVVNTSFTGITVRFGRNTQPNGSADFSYTGGGLDWCNTGAGGTLTITNSTFDNNSATTGPGGGIDLDTSSTTSGTVTMTGVTISNNKSSNPSSGGITIPGDGGGLAILGGFTYNTNITNSTITGNAAQTSTGGGVYFSQSSNSSSSLTISGTTVSNNSAFSIGGGISFNGSTGGSTSFTLNQNSTVSGNTSGTGASGVAQGGGVFVAPFAGSAIINKTTIINNVLSATATTNRGGAGIAAGQGNVTISYNRIVNNTGTTLGTGLNKDINAGTTNAAENWWGCSTGPSAAPCDTAVLTAGSANSLITTPYIVLRHTASPTTIAVGQTSTLTASFLTDSANNALSLSNITVLIGLPITFNNPVNGTISGAQANIQANGTATATFTGTSGGAGSADAIVDKDVAAAGRPNRATITVVAPPTISKTFGASSILQNASTSLSFTITSPAANTVSLTGISFTDTLPAGLIVATPNGASGSCGGGTITATQGSGTVSLSGATLAAGTSCTFSVNVTGTTPGVKSNSVTVNSTNGGTGNTSTVSVTVIAPPDLTVSKSHAGNFTRGQNGAQYTITAANSGGSSTSGNVSVVDTLPSGLAATAISGSGWSCDLGTLTCTRSDALAAAASYPTITLTVNVASNAPNSVTNSATVSGGGETNTTNNTANDVTTITAPTAATVEIGGLVTLQTGRGISGAQVIITDQSGNFQTARTNPFGYFRFSNVRPGETYIVSVISKNNQFAPQAISPVENLTDLIFTAF